MIGFPVSSNVPQWTKYTIPFTSVKVAALTKTINVVTVASKTLVHATIMNVTTAFAGTTDITGSLGKAGDLSAYQSAQNVDSLATFNQSSGALIITNLAGTTVIQAQFVSTIDNLSLLTQGSVDFYILTSTLP